MADVIPIPTHNAIEERADRLADDAKALCRDIVFRAGLTNSRRGELTMTHVYLHGARLAIDRAKAEIDRVVAEADKLVMSGVAAE